VSHIRKYKLHYAWVILFSACVLNIASRADAGSFGVFVEPLVDLFGWSRGDISVAYSLAFIVGLPAVVIMGWLGDRYGARPLMIGAAVLITAGTFLLGTITELWQFYLFYGFFVGSMGHAAYTVLLPVILTRWFNRHMGLAVGIYWAAMGIGPMIFAPVFRWLIETRGWERAFTPIAIVVGSAFAAATLRAQQHQLVADDLGRGVGHPFLLVLPCLQPPLDVNLLALLDILGGDLGHLAEEHQTVPLGLLDLLSGRLVGPRFRRRKRDVGDRVAARGIAGLRRLADVADQLHSIQGCHVSPS